MQAVGTLPFWAINKRTIHVIVYIIAPHDDFFHYLAELQKQVLFRNIISVA